MHLYSILIVIFGIVEAEIELVQVLFRHGDRAPSFSYPTDPHSEDSWPRGFSQLTELGYSQAQELGEYLRYNYMKKNKVVNKNFNRNQVWVRSSAKDRCIETAMGVVNGLFPSQLVPVHTYSTHKEDLLLKPNSLRCDVVDQAVDRDKEVLYRQRGLEHRLLFKHISEHTKLKVTMSNIADIYNSVFREYSNGLRQPDWVWDRLDSSQNRTVFEEIVELKRQHRLISFNSAAKSRLRTGFLLSEINRHFSARTEGISQKTLHLFASHDATLTSLMYNLDFSNEQLPPYAAALLFELHNINQRYYIKMLYRNSTTSEPHQLRLPGCEVLCPFNEWITLIGNRSILSKEQFEEECRLPAEKVPPTSNVWSKLTHVGSWLVVLLQLYVYYSYMSLEYKH